MQRWLALFCRGLLALVMLAAGLPKLLNPADFSVVVSNYGLVPDALLLPVAIFLPLLEVVAGIGLLFSIRGCLNLTLMLFLLFIAVLSYGLWLGLDIDCGCFGPEDPEHAAMAGLRTALYRDLLLLFPLLYLYYFNHKTRTTP